MRTGLWASAAMLSASVIVSALAGGCSSTPAAADGRLCTPGNYVYCRCANRDEGTKLCKDDGQSFEACQPCPDGQEAPPDSTTPEDAGGPPVTPPAADAGFTPVDAGPPPDTGAPSLDAQCTGRLTLLGGNDQTSDTYSAVYRGGGAFEIGMSTGPGMRSNAQMVTVGTSLLAVYMGRLSSLVGAKYEATWSPPTSFQSTAGAPSLAAAGAQARVVYLGLDGLFYAGTYATGWDTADTLAEPAAGSGVPGKSTPALAAAGTSVVYAFTGNDGSLEKALSSGSGFASPTKILSTAYASPPTMAAMNGGAKDLMIAYTGSDLALHTVTRESSNKAWNTSVLVSDTAQTNDPPGLVALPGGKALIVWRAVDKHAFYSIFDPSKVSPWSPPAELVAGANPTLAAPPVVAPAKCGGADAVIAYAEDGGGVSVLHYTAGVFAGPYAVPGMTKLTYLGVGEL
jgi:hypothetical protein